MRDFDCAAGRRAANEEERCAGNPEASCIGEVPKHLFPAGSAEAVIQPATFDAGRDCLCAKVECSKLALHRKELIVDLPEQALPPAALRDLRGHECSRVDFIERQVAEDVADPPGRNVSRFDSLEGVPEMSGAKRTLEVGELDDDDWGSRVSLEG